MEQGAIPDWQAPLWNHGGGFYRRADGMPGSVAIPSALKLDRGDNVQPLKLTLYRQTGPKLRTAGRLDLHWRLAFADAAEFMRSSGEKLQRPVSRARPSWGAMRLFPAIDEISLSRSLAEPVEITGRGAFRGPAIHRLDAHDAEMMQSLLLGSGFPVALSCQVAVPGLAPRFPLRVSVNRKRAVTALKRIESVEGFIPDAGLVEAFVGKLPSGIAIEGKRPTGPDNRVLAEALRDHVAAEFLKPATPSTPDQGASWMLREDVDRQGELHFDLSRKVIRHRLVANRFDAGGTLAAIDPEKLIEHKTVDALPRHGKTITIMPNLPVRPEGVLEWGVRLEVPPSAPERPQAIHKTMVFTGDSEPVEVPLEIGPREQLSFNLTGYAVTFRDGRFSQVEGSPRQKSDDILIVGSDDIPVDSRQFEIARRLADSGKLALIIDTAGVRREALWPSEALRAAFWIDEPDDAEVRIRINDAGREATSLPIPHDSGVLDLDIFGDFGSREVQLVANLEPGQHLAIDVGESRDGDHTTLSFTSSRRERTHRWFAESPFAEPLRIRRHGTPDWMEVPVDGNPIDLAALNIRPEQVA